MHYCWIDRPPQPTGPRISTTALSPSDLARASPSLLSMIQHIGRARRIANLENGCAGAKKCAHVINGAQDRSGHAERMTAGEWL